MSSPQPAQATVPVATRAAQAQHVAADLDAHVGRDIETNLRARHVAVGTCRIVSAVDGRVFTSSAAERPVRILPRIGSIRPVTALDDLLVRAGGLVRRSPPRLQSRWRMPSRLWRCS